MTEAIAADCEGLPQLSAADTASEENDRKLVLSALAANAGRFAWTGMGHFDAGREWDRCLELGVTVLLRGSPAYPALLASIPDPPPALYVHGSPDFETRPGLAVVGSRRPTPYGLRVARNLAGEAAGSGAAVASGLARGIDTEAHRAALAAGGVTWAVLGSGLGRLYPPENAGLARDIAASGGTVVSEAPLDCPPMPANFPRRNRVISGLSWGVVVVEGGKTSGALITARAALEQGREVFAVPGPVDSPLSDGPNALIKDGAVPVSGFADVRSALPRIIPHMLEKMDSSAMRAHQATHEEEKILELLASQALRVEELLRATGWGVERLSQLLAELEVQGLIEVFPGQIYARR